MSTGTIIGFLAGIGLFVYAIISGQDPSAPPYPWIFLLPNSLLMVLGGSFGNLFDRIYYRAVPDFIDIHYESFHWFVFNVADIFITLGIICLIIVEFIFNNKKENNE